MEDMDQGVYFLEEANNWIILHEAAIAVKEPNSILDVHSIDTDVFVFFICFYALLPVNTTIRMTQKRLEIQHSYHRLRPKHSAALIGWYMLNVHCSREVIILEVSCRKLRTQFHNFLTSNNATLDTFSVFGIEI